MSAVDTVSGNALQELSRLLQVGIGDVSAEIGSILVGLAGVGLFSLAVVNLIKAFLEPRYHFHRSMVRAWLSNGLERNLGADQLGIKDQVDKLEEFVIEFSTGQELTLFYHQPSENLITQIGTAISIALENPHWNEHAAVLYKLVPSKHQRILDEYLDLSLKSKQFLPNDTRWKTKEILSTRLQNVMDGCVKGLALKLDFYWKLCMQLLAIAISITTIAVIAEFSIRYMVLAIFAGFLAPIAHDMLSGFKAVKI